MLLCYDLFSLLFFAEELGVSRDTGDTGTNLAEILSNALPQTSSDFKIKEKSSDSSVSIPFF